jgi:hypothetical protein
MTTVSFVYWSHFAEGFISAFLLMGLWKLLRWIYRRTQGKEVNTP